MPKPADAETLDQPPQPSFYRDVLKHWTAWVTTALASGAVVVPQLVAVRRQLETWGISMELSVPSLLLAAALSVCFRLYQVWKRDAHEKVRLKKALLFPPEEREEVKLLARRAADLTNRLLNPRREDGFFLESVIQNIHSNKSHIYRYANIRDATEDFLRVAERWKPEAGLDYRSRLQAAFEALDRACSKYLTAVGD